MTEAEQICAGYHGPLESMVLELANDVVFLAGKLEDTREKMGKTSLVMKYDNGGGQTGIRRNPVYDAYNATLRTFASSLTQLEALLGDSINESARPTLDKFKVISMKRASGE